jgi:hypothetical protein
VLGGLTGEVLANGLITLGLGAAVLLMCLEVGLSEEQELAREEKRRSAIFAGEPSPPGPQGVIGVFMSAWI